MNQNNKATMENKISSLLLPELSIHQNGDYQPLGAEARSANQSVDVNVTADGGNQAGASDKLSDKNSTDDEPNNVIGNIVLLPNNFLSDDELSTNSDDCVYAYRGADFDPVHVSHDDETDYLEMDFEPDPASEIEQEPHQLNVSNNSHELIASPIYEHDDKEPLPLFDANPKIQLDLKCNGGDWKNPIEELLKKSEGDSKEHSDWTNGEAYVECNGVVQHNKDKLDENAHFKTTESNNLSNDKETAHELDGAVTASTTKGYYDKTISLCPKYTGTIPKTTRFQIRTTKAKPTATAVSVNQIKSTNESPALSSSVNNTAFCPKTNAYDQTCKRWKVSKETKPTTGDGNSYHELFRLSHVNLTPKLPTTTFRSMSVPCDDFLFAQNGDSDRSGHIENIARSQSSLFCDDSSQSELCEDLKAAIHERSVTFSSINCTFDKIIDALKSINVHPNSSKLQEVLNASNVNANMPLMNVPEYLVYASKQNCNFKAIVKAIQQSCDDVEVNFLPINDELSMINESVRVPVRMILSRVSNNGSLSNILQIKNKRLHQANVLGKVVNVIRKFSDMRNDQILDNYITIPHYYRAGFVCVTNNATSASAQNQSTTN